MAVFITGGSGRLGKELRKVFLDAIAPTHEELDIRDARKVEEHIIKSKFDTIIHCAALTGIQQCEQNKESAWETNVLGSQNLVNACIKSNLDCYFVYISTACVFYGDRGNYSEDDIPYPKNFYSLTKLLGEFVVKSHNLARWLIIRTNFTPRERWPYPKAFVDRWGTYLFADDLALAIKRVIDQKLTGVVHICGEDKVSMYQLATITTADIKPMTLAEYSGPPLTEDMSLSSKRILPFKLRREI